VADVDAAGEVDAVGEVDGEWRIDIFTFAYTFSKERRIGYRKGPGRAGGKLTRSILLNSSTIPKGRRVEVEERESGENVGCSERVVRMWAVERAQDGVVASEKVC
jgi:hypothetical protein